MNKTVTTLLVSDFSKAFVQKLTAIDNKEARIFFFKHLYQNIEHRNSTLALNETMIGWSQKKTQRYM